MPSVLDDPSAYKDPQRHVFRTSSSYNMCVACGSSRAKHLHAADGSGHVVDVKNGKAVGP